MWGAPGSPRSRPDRGPEVVGEARRCAARVWLPPSPGQCRGVQPLPRVVHLCAACFSTCRELPRSPQISSGTSSDRPGLGTRDTDPFCYPDEGAEIQSQAAAPVEAQPAEPWPSPAFPAPEDVGPGLCGGPGSRPRRAGRWGGCMGVDRWAEGSGPDGQHSLTWMGRTPGRAVALRKAQPVCPDAGGVMGPTDGRKTDSGRSGPPSAAA